MASQHNFLSFLCATAIFLIATFCSMVGFSSGSDGSYLFAGVGIFLAALGYIPAIGFIAIIEWPPFAKSFATGVSITAANALWCYVAAFENHVGLGYIAMNTFLYFLLRPIWESKK